MSSFLPLIWPRPHLMVLIWNILCTLRLVLEFDLFFYAFGKMGTVVWAWGAMFAYTLLVPYYTVVFWGSLYHSSSSKLGLSVVTGLTLSAMQTYMLGHFPIHVVLHYQLPPASRFIVILEQVSVCTEDCTDPLTDIKYAGKGGRNRFV